ncbi:MAG: DUF2206 domain-containing protein [Chloroflexi bacterium]|nr:DUF2206 domain-containing protein [Chloroflexota bacterium]
MMLLRPPIDWPIGRFLNLVLAIQIGILVVVALALLGYALPVAGTLIGFVYLTFVPGFLLLRILRIRSLSPVEALLYAVGLSLAFLMFIGLLINWLYPMIGVYRPLSLLSLSATFTVAVLLLMGLSYWIDRGFVFSLRSVGERIPLLPLLFLFILPLLSIAGAAQFNFQQNNILFMVMFPLVAMVVVLAAWGRFIPQRLLPVAVLLIAISLLLHRTLITDNLVGWDVRMEHLVYKLTEQNSLWSSTAGFPQYAITLSVTILPTIYTRFLDISGIWFFKAIYPLFFSLVPLGLYVLYRRQIESRKAFLASFFLMAFPAFYITGTELAKQGMGMLFAVLVVLTMTDERRSWDKVFLTIVFGASMVISYYGMTYLWLIYLALALAVKPLLLGLRPAGGRIGGAGHDMPGDSHEILSGTLVALFFALSFAWYMNTAKGAMFEEIIRWGDHMYKSLNEFLNPVSTDQGVLRQLGMAPLRIPSLWYRLAADLSRFTRVLIGVGALGMAIKVLRRRETGFSSLYLLLSAVGLLSLAMTFVPFFTTGGFRSDRLYFVGLLLLSPFFVLGIDFLFQLISRWLARDIVERLSLAAVLLVLVPYFLFQSGWVFQAVGDIPSSFALSPKVDFARFDRREEGGARWLSKHLGSPEAQVYADVNGVVTFWGYPDAPNIIVLGGWERPKTEAEMQGFFRKAEVPPGAYLYLRGFNVERGEVRLPPLVPLGEPIYLSIADSGLLQGKGKVYDNGRAQVYK